MVSSPSTADRLRWVLGLGPVLIGAAVLLGWTLDLAALKTGLPGLTTMKANTALGLLAAGAGVLLTPGGGGTNAPRWRPPLASAAGAVAFLLGALTLLQYGSGRPLGLDELLFADPNTTSPPYPGRMSPATAISLACAGAGVLLLAQAARASNAPNRRRQRCAIVAHLLAVVPAAVGYLSLTGYLYRVEGLYSFGAYVAVAIHTATGFALLAPAILLTLPDLGWRRVFADHPVARGTLMRLLPLSLLLPFLAGLVVVWGARAQVYDPLYGPALFALAAAAASVGLAWTAGMAVRRAEQALNEGEVRLRLALDAGGLGAFEWDLRADVVRPTARARAIFAFTPRGGGRLADYFARILPEDAGRARAEVERGLAAGRVAVSYRIRLPDGAIRHVLSQGDVLRDGNGAPARLAGVFTDETERKQAEAALRESEARFRHMADSAPALIWMTDAQGDVTFANMHHEHLFGRPAADVLGKGWTQVVLPEDLQRHAAAFCTAFQARAPFRTETRMRDKDGRVRWLRCEGVPRLDDAGTFLGYTGCNVDITEARLATEELERRVTERTAERDRMWETSPDLMLAIDFEGVFRRVNPAWTSTLGYAPEDLLGRRVNEFVVPDDHGRTTAAREFAAEGGRPAVEGRYRHKDGSLRWISWVAAPAGDVTYATGRDVTAEKARAAELAQAQEALRQSQKMEAVGQLTGGLAHDFNNLLAGISGSLELLQARVSQGRINDLERYLAAAQGAAKRAAALTHRLLAFSRRQTLDPKPTDVNRLIAGMEELVRRTVGPEVAVEVVGSAGLWTTLVDPNQLENALLNLCVNARDAMPGGGRLTIETGNKWLDERAAHGRELPPGQYVSLCVSDSGTGMAPEVIAKAFDPFFTTKPIGMGTGLGLSMVYGFARQSGGQARIYSEPGRGAMVCLYLPRHVGDAEGAELPAELARAPRAEQGQTVLVVDDEPTVRLLVTEVLEDLGYTAIEAADGAAGLRVLHSDVHLDLLITDVGLPGMNGRQLADAARERRPDLRVLFITGYAENAVLSHGHLDRGTQVLTKPFAMNALASRIKGLIDGA